MILTTYANIIEIGEVILNVQFHFTFLSILISRLKNCIIMDTLKKKLILILKSISRCRNGNYIIKFPPENIYKIMLFYFFIRFYPNRSRAKRKLKGVFDISSEWDLLRVNTFPECCITQK